MKTVSKVERFENNIVIMTQLLRRQIALTENAAATNTNYSNYLDIANNKFPLVFTVSNRFHRFHVDG